MLRTLDDPGYLADSYPMIAPELGQASVTAGPNSGLSNVFMAHIATRHTDHGQTLLRRERGGNSQETGRGWSPIKVSSRFVHLCRY